MTTEELPPLGLVKIPTKQGLIYFQLTHLRCIMDADDSDTLMVLWIEGRDMTVRSPLAAESVYILIQEQVAELQRYLAEHH